MSYNQEITDEFIKQSVDAGKQYCLFLYKAGPNINQSSVECEKLQQEHLRYLFHLRAEGLLILNGPVIEEVSLKGIGIFNFSDKDKAKNLLNSDPAVKAARLTYEIYEWFGLPGDMLPS